MRSLFPIWQILFALLTIKSFYCIAQESVLMFSGEVLANPIENSQWFDCNIELIEISIFENNPIEKVMHRINLSI